MKRGIKRALVKGCVAATPVAGVLAGCDRSSPPPNPPAATAPAVNEDQPDSPVKDTADSTTEEDVAAPSGESTAAPAADRPSDNQSAPAEFTPPAVDLSDYSEFEQDQVRKIRDMVMAAPGSADRVTELGMHYCVRGFDDEAAICFERATRILPSVMRYHYLHAIALEKYQPEKAIEAYRTAIALDGKYPAAYVNLGKLLLEDDAIEARNMYQKAVELDPADAIAHFGLGRCEVLEKKLQDAIAHFEKAVELQPNYRDAHEELSRIYEGQGNREKALAHESAGKEGRKGLVKNDPIRYELATRLRSEADVARDAVEAARSGKVEEALNFLKQSMRRGYRGAPIHQAMGEVLMMDGRANEAVIKFQVALKFAPKSNSTKILLGSALIEVGELEQAETILKEVAAAEPGRSEVVNRLGVIDIRRGRPQEAEKKFREALEARPGDADYLSSLAQCLSMLGRRDEALETVDKALTIQPKRPGAHLLRGRVLMQSARTEEAVAALKEAIALAPSLEQAYLLLSEIARGKERYAESIEWLEKGLRTLPDSAAILNDLAYTLATCADERLRDPGRAVTHAGRACELTLNHNVNYLDTLASAHAAAGAFQPAATALRKAIDRAVELGAKAEEITSLRQRLAEYEARAQTQPRQ